MKKDIRDFFGKENLYAVIFGGAGYEHSVSRLGAANFISAAESCGFEILPIFIDKNGAFSVYLGEILDIADQECEIDGSLLFSTYPVRLGDESGFLVSGEVLSVRLAVPLLHGDFGEDGAVQGALECAGIRYIGASVFAGALTSDKAFSKAVAVCAGVRTLPWLTVTRSEKREDILRAVSEGIGYPVFIKPCRLGSSIGASRATCASELSKSLDRAFAVADRVMAERALTDFCELECAWLDVGDTHVIAHPGEISVPGGFYGYREKYSGRCGVRLFPRANIPPETAERIKAMTQRLAAAFGVRHLARFDYFLDRDGTVYFNEVNSFPGMTGGSLYAAMLAESGISFSDFIKKLLLQ